MSQRPVIVWFRQDLRLGDNPALSWATSQGPVVPVFILDDAAAGPWKRGAASRWWLHQSLVSLTRDFKVQGVDLIMLRGSAETLLPDLARQVNAAAVVWNRCYEPWVIDRDTRLKAALKAEGLETHSFNSALLFEPWTVKTGSGGFFKVYTPFAKACLSGPQPDQPLPVPAHIHGVQGHLLGENLDKWTLLPTSPDWAGGLRNNWTPGEQGVVQRLNIFLDTALASYADERDRPDRASTSRLAPHLHFGEISPRQVWHAVQLREPSAPAGCRKYLSELLWREFSYHLLYHVPHLPEAPFNPRFQDFPWQEDAGLLKAWQKGQTGYPIVDAGMRELWHTGWMHNRVRMIAASFLVKHLLQPWQTGEVWFWDTLVDADLANNAASWQWVAGCGADAAPYFRIFNPVLQGEKFDPDGSYVRCWVPELRDLPTKWIHRPWEAPASVLQGAGVTLGRSYPQPIIALDKGRDRALAAFEQMKAAADY